MTDAQTERVRTQFVMGWENRRGPVFDRWLSEIRADALDEFAHYLLNVDRPHMRAGRMAQQRAAEYREGTR